MSRTTRRRLLKAANCVEFFIVDDTSKTVITFRLETRYHPPTKCRVRVVVKEYLSNGSLRQYYLFNGDWTEEFRFDAFSTLEAAFEALETREPELIKKALSVAQTIGQKPKEDSRS